MIQTKHENRFPLISSLAFVGGLVAVVFAVLLIGAPSSEARHRVGYERWGLGPVHLYDSITSVTNKVGKPIRQTRPKCIGRCDGCQSWSAWTSHYRGGRIIRFATPNSCRRNEARVRLISTTNPNDRARAGIHVGSGIARVKRAYPDGDCYYTDRGHTEGFCRIDRWYCESGPVPKSNYVLDFFFRRIGRQLEVRKTYLFLAWNTGSAC